MDRIVSNMLAAYARPICGFFDSNIKHGGPDPQPHKRPDGNDRRPVDRKRRQTAEDESDGSELLKYDKNNPIKGLNQILGNFRTWSERHINECWGQRKHKHVSNRMQRWIRNALLTIGPQIEPKWPILPSWTEDRPHIISNLPRMAHLTNVSKFDNTLELNCVLGIFEARK